LYICPAFHDGFVADSVSGVEWRMIDVATRAVMWMIRPVGTLRFMLAAKTVRMLKPSSRHMKAAAL
jgi:hypothetical protein